MQYAQDNLFKFGLGMLLAVGVLLVSGCGGGGGGGGGGDGTPPPQFALGDPTVRTLSAAGDTEVSVLGHTFRFPEGATGKLTVAKIVSGPTAPFPGEGLYVNYDGDDPMELVLPGTPDGISDYPMVLGYGKVRGIFDDSTGNRERWIALPWVQLPDERMAFDLNAVGTPPEPTPSRGRAQRQQPADRLNHYWISRLPVASNEIEKRTLLSLQARDYTDEFLNALTPARRSQVEARIKEKILTIEHDGNYYQGFWWRSPGWARIFRPTVHVTLDGFSLAHELGHYYTHLLVGDDVQSDLEDQASLGGQHGIRDVVGRGVVLEEYGYFIEFFLIGTGGRQDLHRPYDMFKGLDPWKTDFPSIEGFGAAMLACLNRTDPTIKDLLTGNLVDVPTIGLDYGRIFDIIAQGATHIDQLRQNIGAALTAEEAQQFSILVERMGWSYHGKGRLVDPQGNPVAGVTVEPVGKVGTQEYLMPGSVRATTNSKGEFTLSRLYPGRSHLRITQGTNVIDAPISVDWSRPTNTLYVDLGDIPVVPRVQDTRYMSVDLKLEGRFHKVYYNQTTGKVFDGVESGGPVGPMNLRNIPVAWSGDSFSASLTTDQGGEYTFSGTVDGTGRVLSISVQYQYSKDWYDSFWESNVAARTDYSFTVRNIQHSLYDYSDTGRFNYVRTQQAYGVGMGDVTASYVSSTKYDNESNGASVMKSSSSELVEPLMVNADIWFGLQAM